MKPQYNGLFELIILNIEVVNQSQPQETDECKCVKSYQCDRNTRNVISDGTGMFDIRSGIPCDCKCPKLEVCCRVKPTSLYPEMNETATTASPPKPTPVPPRPKGCGFRQPDGVGFKISGDSEVQFGEFPWMVGILEDIGGYRCGGSLIHPSVVLTAAHCVSAKKNYIARAGEWDSSDTKENLKHQDLRVSTIRIHEDYFPGSYYNDVALLFLDGSFTFDDHIDTACLAPTDAVMNEERCYATGWGKTQYGSRDYPAVLKKIDLPLVARKTCEEKLRQTRLGHHFNLHRSFMCAGGEKGKDTCIGDGGGPLVCPVKGKGQNRYQQVGIVAWGIGCNGENTPAVYANVQYLRPWIDKQMTERNLNTSYYRY